MAAEATPVQDNEKLLQAESLSRAPTSPPVEVPGYEPEKFLGRGAFGEVWVAIQRNTGVRTAIKFFTHRSGFDWSLLTREVEKLRFLANDRYVVQLLEVGWDAEPPYYVMEYAEHGSLEDLLRAGPLPVEEAVALFRESAIGLSHAHNKGILHCDLKPANILLDQDHRPRLADFGQARLTDEHSPALGTWFYMAPEQADFQAVPDVRWDVYALGAVLYTKLTGQPPHRTEAAAAQIKEKRNLEERLRCYRKLICEAPPLTLHRLRHEVDRALADIVDRCLAADPRRRYPNVQAVLDALDERTLRRTRRPVLLLGALGPALAMLVIFLLGWFPLRTTLNDTAEEIRSAQMSEFRNAARFNARGVAQEIRRRLSVLQAEAGKDELRRLLEAAQKEPDFQTPRRQELQTYLVEMQLRNASAMTALFWSVNDAKGSELAITPLAKSRRTVDRSFRYRDYFHGKGRDYAPDDPEVATLKPIRKPYQSVVFMSTTEEAGHPYSVGFTVPVWPRSGGADPIGILGNSLELGEFGQTRLSDRHWMVLADMRSLVNGRRGVILQHPELEAMKRAGVPPADMVYYLDPKLVEQIDGTRPARQANGAPQEEVAVIENYVDPLAARNERYAGKWLAAIDPIFIQTAEGEVDSGWVVIAQGTEEDALGWAEPVVNRLRRGLLWRGIIGAVLVILVVTALSSYVVRSLHRSTQARLTGSPRPIRTPGGSTPGAGDDSWRSGERRL